MICPRCQTEMKLRTGKNCDFWFCPNQHRCKQPTITDKKTQWHNKGYELRESDSYEDILKAYNNSLPNPSRDLWEIANNEEDKLEQYNRDVYSITQTDGMTDSDINSGLEIAYGILDRY